MFHTHKAAHKAERELLQIQNRLVHNYELFRLQNVLNELLNIYKKSTYYLILKLP